MDPINVFLSKRNILTLLSKLDRVRLGDQSQCTIIKHDNQHKKYPQNHPEIAVVAVEDEDYNAEYGKDIEKVLDSSTIFIFITRVTLEYLSLAIDKTEMASLTIVRYKYGKYTQNADPVVVVALPDKEYYTTREAGDVHPKDDPSIGS